MSIVCATPRVTGGAWLMASRPFSPESRLLLLLRRPFWLDRAWTEPARVLSNNCSNRGPAPSHRFATF
jgi:hypothetical protein